MNLPAHRHALALVVTLLAGWVTPAARAADTWPVVRCTIHFPQAAITPARTVYIPFTQIGQLMVVEARVDSITGWFIVDTGSEHLVLNQHHFGEASGDRRVASVGNTGRVASARERQVDSVSVEGLTMHRRLAHIADLGHIEQKKNTRIAGILGFEVLGDFDLMIDFPERFIVLIPVDKKGKRLDPEGFKALPYDSLDFSLVHHLIMVDAEINRIKLKMILDSGAELNLIDRNVNRKALDNFTVLKRVNMTGVGNQSVEVLAGVMRDVKCGNQVTGKMNTLLTSLDELNESFRTRAMGVLGYEFLKSRRILISYRNEKLYFFQPVRS